MTPINEYPVFEVDQVLTADHLNQLFDYLDEQNRLTRTCLIGIGIVCGLDSYYETNSISITKGVGVTSLGYLINFGDHTYTYARKYSLPNTVTADEKSFYNGINMWQLFTPDTDNPLSVDDEPLSDQNFLQDKVVILLLELDIDNLKNCTTDDCDDKGSQAELNVLPLLVNAEDLSTFIFTGFETGKAALPDIVLKRYNVPFKELKSPTDVLNAFYAVTDATSLSKIADGYSKAYETFKTMLPAENFNPFTNLLSTLNSQLNNVKTNSYIFTEYFYDYIDDLVKAYNEFREKGNSLLTACCPDENLFPYHLALCEALGDSRSTASAYRNYFIHSPVFGEQKLLAGELQQLFTRMKLLKDKFTIPDIASTRQPVIKITPSEYGRYYLSKRAIPYYYDTLAVLNSWNYDKTRKGKASKNLSYYSDKYSSDDAVVNPLLYELEPYNFFRVEGHIGTNVNFALANIVGKKQQFSLPFDVIALNVAVNNKITNQNLSKCYFSDLESAFNVLIAELLCKLHLTVCTFSNFPYITSDEFVKTKDVASGAKMQAEGAAPEDTPGATINPGVEFFQTTVKASASRKVSSASFSTVYTLQSQSFIDQMKYIHPYKKGTYLTHFCDPQPFGNYKSVGQIYLETISKTGASFPKPAASSSTDIDLTTLYAHMFYYIDCVEETMATILPYYLHNIDYSAFEYRYKLMITEAAVFASLLSSAEGNGNNIIVDELTIVVNLCIDEQIKTLLDEYYKRLKEISIERLFAAYTKYHSGIDHKAGVTRGGTFILVYEEKASTQFRGNLSHGIVVVEAPEPQKADLAKEQPGGVFAFAKDADTKTADATAATANDASCAQQFVNLNKYKLTEEEYVAVTGLIGKISTTGDKAVDTFVVGQDIVFADFFLPYLCCSDCAPISYIVQETPPADVTISADPKSICNNDPKPVTITVGPAGGTFNIQDKLTKISDTVFQVSAADLAIGDNIITYQDEGVSASVTVTVLEAPVAEFTTQVDSFKTSVQFTSTDNTGSHSWEFGDGSTSTDINPLHQYVEEATSTFTVTHTITSENNCIAKITKDVIVTFGQISIHLSTDAVCQGLQTPVTIAVSPANGTFNVETNKIDDFTYSFATAFLSPGPVEIKYTVGSNSATATLMINALPDSDFDPKNNPSVPRDVQFTSHVDPANGSFSHSWEFGDPQSGTANKSGAANPLHSFKGTEVQFNVTHRVKDKNGCESTTIKTVSVNVEGVQKTCNDLSEIDNEFNNLRDLDPDNFDNFTKAFKDWGKVSEYFKALESSALGKPGADQILFFEQFKLSGAAVDQLLISWLPQLFNSKERQFRLLSIALYRILAELACYIVCLETGKEDLDRMKKVFDLMVKELGSLTQADIANYSFEEKQQLSKLKQLFIQEHQRVIDNNEQSIKAGYLLVLEKLIDILNKLGV